MAMSKVADNMPEHLRCLICQEQFRQPKMLPCGHTFCLEPCLTTLGRDKTSVVCPECRETHPIPGNGVTGFPPNIVIVRLLDQRPKITKNEPTQLSVPCPDCLQEKATEFVSKCSHCRMVVCDTCKIKHVKTLASQVPLLLTGLKEKVAQAQNPKLKQKAMENLNSAVEKLTNNLEEITTKLHRAIDNQKNVIQEQIDTVKREEEEKIEAVVRSLDTCVLKANEIQVASADQLTGDNLHNLEFLVPLKQQCEEFVETLEKMEADLDELPVMDVCLDETQVNVRQGFTFTVTEKIQEAVKQEDQSASERIKAAEVEVTVINRTLGPASVCVGITGSGNQQFQYPSDVAVCPKSRNIVVADCNNSRLQVFNQTGGFIQALGCEGVYTDRNNKTVSVQCKPDYVAVSASGYIYASSLVATDNHRKRFIHAYMYSACEGYT